MRVVPLRVRESCFCFPRQTKDGRLLLASSQVVRKLKRRLDGAAGKIARHDLDEWKVEGKSFLAELMQIERANPLTRGGGKQNREPTGMAAYDVTCMTDWQLKALLGKGGAIFNPCDDDSSIPLSKRYRITVLHDSVNENMRVTSFHLYKQKKRAFFLFDPIHIIWNALVKADMYGVVILFTLMVNQERAPFGNKGNLTSMRESWTDTLSLIGEDSWSANAAALENSSLLLICFFSSWNPYFPVLF